MKKLDDWDKMLLIIFGICVSPLLALFFIAIGLEYACFGIILAQGFMMTCGPAILGIFGHPSQQEKEWSEELLEIERKKLEFKRRKMEREVSENVLQRSYDINRGNGIYD